MGLTVTVSAVFDERVVATLPAPWAMAFLPDGRMLVTERPSTADVVNPTDQGHIRVVTQDGVVSAALIGVPDNVGVLDVVLDPNFATNHIIYFSFIDRDPTAPRVGRDAADMSIDPAGIAVGRAVLDVDNAAGPTLTSTSVIWHQYPDIVSNPGSGEPGGRIAFSPDGKYLYITAGDRQEFDPVQSLDNTLGKTVRIFPDGTIPADNPFVDVVGARPEIWSLGHRNPYGLVFDGSSRLWENEMGPKGGDELNVIKRADNYGWPNVSYGNNYDDSPIAKPAPGDGYDAASLSWTPVIAPSGMISYTGTAFPNWKGDLIVSGLQSHGLVVVDTDGEKATEIARIDLGARTRDVVQGPDGSLWVLLDQPDGRLVQLQPSASTVFVTGGSADDRYVVDNAHIAIVEQAGGGNDTVLTSVSYVMPQNVETMILATGASATLFGNSSDGETLVGNDLGTSFVAGAGNTMIVAGRGDDSIAGGGGYDVAVINDTVANSNIVFATSGGSFSTSQPFTVASADGTDVISGMAVLKFNDGAIYTGNVTAIDQQYVTYGGRHATTAELGVWSPVVEGGGTLAQIRTAILAEAMGTPYIDAQIAAAYQSYGGRAPQASEVQVWENILSGNDHDFSAVRNAILNDPLGKPFVDAQITAAYLTYGGRAPNAAETAVWVGLLNDHGHDFSIVRTAILNDPLGQVHTEAGVSQIYETYADRAPTGADIDAAKLLLVAGGDFVTVRTAVLDDPAVHAHAVEQITAAYQTYGGRAPAASELSVWNAELHQGGTYDDVRAGILADPLGQHYADAHIPELYERYFGRAPIAAETATWKGLLGSGASYDTLTDTLLLDGGNTLVHRLTGTPAADEFAFAAHFGDVAVSAFDASADRILLHDAGLGSIDPLGAAFAKQVVRLDGGHDVLLAYNASETILLHDVSLSDLHATNFIL
jgi:glucose/arabinose dehydrogenase